MFFFFVSIRNFSLLSFGGEAEEDEEQVVSATKAMEKEIESKMERKKQKKTLQESDGLLDSDREAAKQR